MSNPPPKKSKASGRDAVTAAKAKTGSTGTRFIDGKTAAKAAAEYLHSLNPSAGSITIEELEKDTAATPPCWIVTLSYREMTSPSKFSTMFDVESGKAFKVFRVHAATSDILSMKIRSV